MKLTFGSLYPVYQISHIFLLIFYSCQLSSNLHHALFTCSHALFTTGKNQDSRVLSSYKFYRNNAAKISIALQCALCTSKNTIQNLVENFKRKESVHNQNRGASGRPVSVRTGEKIEDVRSSVVEDPNKSYRKRAQTLVMKPSTMLTILKKELKMTPYKMQILLTLQQSIKTVQNPSISFLCNCNSRAVFFKPQWTNYPVCTDSAPRCTFSNVKWTLIDFIGRFTTPSPAVL